MTDRSAGNASSKPRLGVRVLHGIEMSVLGQATVFIVNLIATPIIVHGLGTDAYGLYTLIWTLLNYLLILNLGMGTGAQKYTAQYQALPDQRPLSALLRKSLWIQLGASVVGAGILWMSRHWVADHVFHVQDSMKGSASWVFACIALAAPAYFIFQFAMNVLYGMQRFATYNFFTALHSLLTAAGAVMLLHLGLGITEIAGLFALTCILLAVISLWMVRKTLLLNKDSSSQAPFNEFFRFSLKSFVSYLMWVVTYQSDRLLIGSLLSLTQLSYYGISANIAQKFNQLCGAVSTAAFPLMTELHGAGEQDRLRRFYLKATELSLFFILPLTILSFVLVPQFMTLWLGAEFSRLCTWPYRLLVTANLAYVLTSMPIAVATGKGAPQFAAYLNASRILLLLVLWPVFIPRWGIAGAALGLFAAEWIVTPTLAWRVHKIFLAVNWRTFWSEACWRPVVAGMALAAGTLFIHGNIGSWIELLGVGLIGACLFWSVGYYLLDSDAKELLRHWVLSRLQLKKLV